MFVGQSKGYPSISVRGKAGWNAKRFSKRSAAGSQSFPLPGGAPRRSTRSFLGGDRVERRGAPPGHGGATGWNAAAFHPERLKAKRVHCQPFFSQDLRHRSSRKVAPDRHGKGVAPRPKQIRPKNADQKRAQRERAKQRVVVKPMTQRDSERSSPTTSSTTSSTTVWASGASSPTEAAVAATVARSDEELDD